MQEPEPTVEESPIETSAAAADPVTDPEIRAEVKIEVIKAPKVELSGLKVLGKIELPE